MNRDEFVHLRSGISDQAHDFLTHKIPPRSKDEQGQPRFRERLPLGCAVSDSLVSGYGYPNSVGDEFRPLVILNLTRNGDQIALNYRFHTALFEAGDDQTAADTFVKEKDGNFRLPVLARTE